MRLALSPLAAPVAAAARGAPLRAAAPCRLSAAAPACRRGVRLAPLRAAAGSEPPASESAAPPDTALSGNPLRPNETVAEAKARRATETEAVEARLTRVRSRAELDAALAAAGSRVVMLEVISNLVCDLDSEPRPEAQWKDDEGGSAARMAPCIQLRSGLQRVARDCPDVAFLSVDADEQPELAAELGVSVLPTVQFWRNGARLWQTEGADAGLQGSGEAVLYFGDYAADSVRGSDFVRDVADRAAMDKLLADAGPGKLAVLNVSLATATPCIKIFPAFMALAKHLASVASFGRLIADGDGSTGAAAALARDLGVSHTPTFLFFRDGQEVARHVGSSRGDLVGKILEVQGAFGAPPPPPPQRRRAQPQPQQRRASGQAMWR